MRAFCFAAFLVVAGTILPVAPANAQESSTDDLARRTIYRRAVEAVIWGMPAVNFDLLYQAMAKAKGSWNQVVYWSRLPDWKNQTLTPNPDVIYVFPFFDTKQAGPMVMEIPPAGPDGSITGSVDDAWQTALEDVGPAGVDKGQGGKYLILPPGYKDKTPEGYLALPSPTYRSYAILRSNLASGSDADVSKAVAYGKRVKIYPLSRAGNPPSTTFVDAIDVVYDSTIPYDLSFFRSLDRFVRYEPWIERDKVMMDMLKSIGTEKGKTFDPDQKTQAILTDAIAEARRWLDRRYEAVFTTSFNDGKQWVLPAPPGVGEGMMTNFADPDSYPVDGRGVAYSMAYFSAKHLGTGQYYLMTIRDRDRKPLEGRSTYRLNVPADAPVKLYWSATVYDRATHALIRNQPHSSRASTTPGLVKNEDGSVDVYFGPKAPPGKDTNWVPTSADGKFEVLFCFYGPEKPLFDKTWVLPDIELVNSAPETAQAASAAPIPVGEIPVTVENFKRAETDMYLGMFTKEGAFGKFFHHRELPLENTGVRPNRDTLYSYAVFDLEAGPVTISLPDAGKRFMSLMAIDQDHYALETVYAPKAYTYSRERVGTRNLFVAARTLVDPADPQDVKQAQALQDAITVRQPGGPGRFEVPNWDRASQDKIRNALLVLNTTLPDLRNAGGRKDEVDPVRHLIATASAWGLNPDKEAVYLNVTPTRNDGQTANRLDIPADVPVDAFWSVIVYDETVTCGRTRTTPTHSTASRRRRTRAEAYRSSSATATERSRTACRPWRDGTTWCGSTGRGPRYSTGNWKFPEARPAT